MGATELEPGRGPFQLCTAQRDRTNVLSEHRKDVGPADENGVALGASHRVRCLRAADVQGSYQATVSVGCRKRA